jgi:hypothetical protein
LTKAEIKSAVRQHRWTRAEVDRLIDERSGYTPRGAASADCLTAPLTNGATEDGATDTARLT